MPTRLLVRYLTRRPNGGVARSERRITVVGDRIALGRGSDNEVFLKDLRVNYHHATLTVTPDDLVVEAVGSSALRVNDTPVGRASVSPLSRIEVGPYRVAIAPPEADTDLVLEVELVVPEAEGTVERLLPPHGRRLAGVRLGRRAFSWLGFLLLLVIGLGLPIWAFVTPQPAPMQPERPSVVGTLDRIWISGPLSPKHAFLTDYCTTCHERPFQRITAEACLGCHAGTNHHFDRARFAFASLREGDCTGCHAEHVAPHKIVPTQQALCADCHGKLREHPPGTDLLDVAAFDRERHPEFRVTLLDPAGGPARRVALDAAPLPREQSGVVFPHDIHLARSCDRPSLQAEARSINDRPSPAAQRCLVLEQAVNLMDRERLDCADCHQPEPGGAGMRPIRVAEHCGLCHLPQLDAAPPGADLRTMRRIPHGSLDELVAVVMDRELARALGGVAASEPAAPTTRRRAGAEADETQRVRTNGSARERAEARIRDLVERQACAKCHRIDPPVPPGGLAYRIHPVVIADVWMPKARFSHAAHEMLPWRDGRLLGCSDCHAAETSQSSGDVLMPRIETCLACHGPERTSAMVPSTCVMCHVFHRDDCPSMRGGVAATACGRMDAPRQAWAGPSGAAD